MKYKILFFSAAVLLAIAIVGIPGTGKRPVRIERQSLNTEGPCESTCNALETLISGADDSVGTCKKDALCTGISCIEPNNTMILNLTFFPCNGTVSIHYLVLLSENVVANVTTSENYSGMLNDAATNILHLFLTQFDSGVVFGANITGSQMSGSRPVFQNTCILFECGTDTTSTSIDDTTNMDTTTCNGYGLPNGLNSRMPLVILLFAISYCAVACQIY